MAAAMATMVMAPTGTPAAMGIAAVRLLQGVTVRATRRLTIDVPETAAAAARIGPNRPATGSAMRHHALRVAEVAARAPPSLLGEHQRVTAPAGRSTTLRVVAITGLAGHVVLDCDQAGAALRLSPAGVAGFAGIAPTTIVGTPYSVAALAVELATVNVDDPTVPAPAVAANGPRTRRTLRTLRVTGME